MLICSVSARARRTVAVALAEAALAADHPAPGFSIFPLRVDDPASALDLVDAYTGDIMVEAASAAAVVDAGMVYSLRVDEPANAVAVISTAAGSGYTASINEAAGASDNVGASRDAEINEAATALDIGDADTSLIISVNEAATAADSPDATRIAAPAATAFVTDGLVTAGLASVSVLQSGTLLTIQ